MHAAKRTIAAVITLWLVTTAGTAAAVTETAKPAGQPGFHAQVNSHYPWLIRQWWDLRGHQHSRSCGHADKAKQLAKPKQAQPDHATRQPAMVPEFDAATAPLSLALLGALVLLARELRRRPIR